MNESRKALADLFEQLHAMGVESADMPWLSTCSTPGCACDEGFLPDSIDMLDVLGEMMNHDTPGITMGDVLTAAKRAGVY